MNFKTIFPYFICALLLGWIVYDCSGTGPEKPKMSKPIHGKSEIKTAVTHTPVSSPKQGVKVIKEYLPAINLSAAEKKQYEAEIERILKANDSIHLAFMKANDSMQLEILKRETQLQAYDEKYSDTLIDISATGLVSGKINTMQFHYTIKPQALPKPKETAFGLWGGIELGSNTGLDRFILKPNIFIETKNTIYTISADNQKNVYLGLNKPLFRLKR
jgi:hypothetical protein